jgi:anti-sigma regulatory factor (Ser/Thr protein kinase)
VAELPATPHSVRRARELVREALTGSPAEGLIDVAELCVSELVTNAVLHAGTPIRLEVQHLRADVRLGVRDGSTNVPVLAPHTPTASTGRGIAMVAAMAVEWGIEVDDLGKVVWCLLAEREREQDVDVDDVLAAWGLTAADVEPAPRVAAQAPGGDQPQVREVVLVGYPVDLGLRLQEHYEAVVRECQLMAAPREPWSTPLPPRLVELATILSQRYTAELSQLARPDPRRIAAQAQGLHAVDLTFPATSEQLELLASWQHILDDVDAYSASGDLLAPTISPALAKLRGWALREFSRQWDGHPPTPWRGLA